MRTTIANFCALVPLLGLFSATARAEVKSNLSLASQCQVVVNHHLKQLNLGPIESLSAEAVSSKTINVQELERLNDIRIELREIEVAILRATESMQVLQKKYKKEIDRSDELNLQMYQLEDRSRLKSGFLDELNGIESDIRVAEDIIRVLQVPELSSTEFVPGFQEIQTRLRAKSIALKKRNDPDIIQFYAWKAELDSISARINIEDLNWRGIRLRQKRQELENEADELQRKIFDQTGQKRSAIITISGLDDQALATNAEKISTAIAKEIAPIDESLRMRYEAFKKWPDLSPRDKELNVLAGEIREKIGKKLEVDRFYLSDSLAEAKDQLRLIREKRSFVQLT
ncbi:MAG: hypothetical protein KDD50_16265, partial [Bdellovibrionales bacterium]|nr:hypothetical protein [Bdellovibrionales bacterium]